MKVRLLTCAVLLLSAVSLLIFLLLFYGSTSKQELLGYHRNGTSPRVQSLLTVAEAAAVNTSNGRTFKLNNTYNRTSIQSLRQSSMIIDQGIKLKWISLRLNILASSWEEARDSLLLKSPELFHSPKKVLLFPGLISEYSGYDFAGNAFKGGYLGELTQWSDLIAVLHMLGHKVHIASSRTLLSSYEPLTIDYDLLFTDYLGMVGVRDAGLIGKYKCRIRLLDSFGTEPIYSFKTKDYQADPHGDMFTPWNFEHMQQFWTLYPHTPDNSFLGFAFQVHKQSTPHSKRKNQAVLYGKSSHYFHGKQKYLSVIAKEVELHATVNSMPAGYPPVVKHGVLSPKDLTKLLQESRLFIGLGAPFEGPGALEALANGCVFIQPSFNPPLNKHNNAYFTGKPTDRAYTSQVPYLEQFVGEPYVYTVNSENESDVRNAVRKALKTANFSSFLPYEFTQQGMMDRIGTYIYHQNFCEPPSLSLNREVSASSHQSQAINAVDGIDTDNTCYHSEKSGILHWWKVNLGTETFIGRVKITIGYHWDWAKSNNVCSNPYRVSLLDTKGTKLLSHEYHDCRLSYEWKGLSITAQYVHIETLESKESNQLVLCSVEVFPYHSPSLPIWPHWRNLHTIISKPGQNCRDACLENKLICESAFFTQLNTHSGVVNHLGCTVTHTLQEQYADYAPALAVNDDTKLASVKAGHCIITDIGALLGCPGYSVNYRRLCPCRTIVKGQITLPNDE